VTDFGKTVRDKLREAGGAFLRRGKGDHDVWTTADGRRVVVPFRIKSRHTANGILKDAGVHKAF
jgi:predicted RNA binding protein YcfA (HicA-like mRNA interferase family)